MNYVINYPSPIGLLRIYEENKNITAIKFVSNTTDIVETIEEKTTGLLKTAILQLSEYFIGKRCTFDLPIAPLGTPFQQDVWKALLTIPYGKTVTYKYIADLVNCPKGFRAVGLANNRNPIPIIIPCHRVIGANGKLVGYAGGLDRKKQLLSLEGFYQMKNH